MIDSKSCSSVTSCATWDLHNHVADPAKVGILGQYPSPDAQTEVEHATA